MNRLAAELMVPPLAASGRPIRFVAQAPGAGGYEAEVFESGAVHTRSGDWHDFFNALVWMRFPLTKAALNGRHRLGLAQQRAAQAAGRGALRGAATQFDEDGVIVLSPAPELVELLRCHEWKALFWERRTDVLRDMRFVVFGHALYDKLRNPFRGLCGKAVFLDLDAEFADRPLEEQLPSIDRRLAQRWRSEDWYRKPGELAALPVLGIPGVTPENGDPAYYDDRWQFRPLRSGTIAAEVRQAVAGRSVRPEESPGPAEQDAG